jgi:hypothetical protein
LTPAEARQTCTALRDGHVAAVARWTILVAESGSVLATPRLQVAWDELERTRRELVTFQFEHRDALRDRRDQAEAGMRNRRFYPARHRGHPPS